MPASDPFDSMKQGASGAVYDMGFDQYSDEYFTLADPVSGDAGVNYAVTS